MIDDHRKDSTYPGWSLTSGDKPKEFLQLVPRGLLPAMELDGKVMTESLDIMRLWQKERERPYILYNVIYLRHSMYAIYYAIYMPTLGWFEVNVGIYGSPMECLGIPCCT